MAEAHLHLSHPEVVARLKRAEGHLRSIVGMVEAGRPCVELAQQLHAVGKAVANAKRLLIHAPLGPCLEDAVGADGRAARRSVEEFQEITKYL